jgi:hypothetical protein
LIDYFLETFLRLFVPEGMEKSDPALKLFLNGLVTGDGKRNCADPFERFGVVMFFLCEESAGKKKVTRR